MTNTQSDLNFKHITLPFWNTSVSPCSHRFTGERRWDF